MQNPQERRGYRGPIRAVIFDWAGTTVDYGCFAPVQAFQRAFAQAGVPLTAIQARGPMGLAKKDHIRALLQLSPVASAWQARYARLPNEADVDQLYAAAESALRETIIANARVIPGVVELAASLRARGLKLGSTTGYTSELMELLVPLVRAQGYEPDALVCPDEVGGGRPAPWMAFQNLKKLGVFPPEAVVKIGDTVPDIQEGLNAGMWTIGLVRTGNEVGLHPEEVGGIEPVELQNRYRQAADKLWAAGAHLVLDDLSPLEAVLDEINARMSGKA